MAMASWFLALAVGLSPVHASGGWPQLNAFFSLGATVLVEADTLHDVAGTTVLEARVLRCLRGRFPGNSIFLAGVQDGEEVAPGQRWLVALGSDRSVSGTRAFWRRLDRVIGGKPLHSARSWLRVQDVYGMPHVTFPFVDLPVPPELEAQVVRLDVAGARVLFLPLESLVPMIEAAAPQDSDEDGEDDEAPQAPRMHAWTPRVRPH